jgi:hypothetical protein
MHRVEIVVEERAGSSGPRVSMITERWLVFSVGLVLDE